VQDVLVNRSVEEIYMMPESTWHAQSGKVICVMN